MRKPKPKGVIKLLDKLVSVDLMKITPAGTRVVRLNESHLCYKEGSIVHVRPGQFIKDDSKSA